MEEFVLVAKLNKKNEIALKQFYDFFKEENIEYKEELEEKWIGIRQPKYIANIVLYVNKKDEARVIKFIKELENANIQSEEYSELKKYTQEDEKEDDEELKKYKKSQKRLQKIMICGFFSIAVLCIILALVSNFIN